MIMDSHLQSICEKVVEMWLADSCPPPLDHDLKSMLDKVLATMVKDFAATRIRAMSNEISEEVAQSRKEEIRAAANRHLDAKLEKIDALARNINHDIYLLKLELGPLQRQAGKKSKSATKEKK